MLLLKELSLFLKKRVLIEKEHLRSLAKLSSSLAEEKQLKFEGYVIIKLMPGRMASVV